MKLLIERNFESLSSGKTEMAFCNKIGNLLRQGLSYGVDDQSLRDAFAKRIEIVLIFCYLLGDVFCVCVVGLDCRYLFILEGGLDPNLDYIIFLLDQKVWRLL
ncbi:hypothetical protein P8452_67906 [Trifolium repens]|nr:hypothetical protein P8452_67906 [Trifolium repens]